MALELIVGGMHLSPAHGRTVDLVRIDGLEPVAELDWMADAEDADEQAARALDGVGGVLAERRPDALLLAGDRFEVAAAALAATIERIPIVHLHGGEQTVRDTLFCAYKDCQRMIRDQRFKLLEYQAGGVRNAQLFDLARDPDEIDNLADDPKAAGQRKRLHELLQQARREFGDPVDF